MLRRTIWLVAVLSGIGSMAMACGGSQSDPAETDGGNGQGGDGGDDGGGGDGGDDIGGGDEETPEKTECEKACDFAETSCGWIEADSETREEERAFCIELCEEVPECAPGAMEACSWDDFEACFAPPYEETPECAAMCDHVYGECGATFGVSRAECGIGCSEGVFEPAQVECMTTSSCELEALQACLDDEGEEEPPAPDACEVACAHVVGECGAETWTEASCLRVCRASYTAEQTACLAEVACDANPVEACFGEVSCTAMCDRVYNTCESAIGDGSQDDCEVLCMWGLITDTELTCFSSAACGDLAACDETVTE